ncbi:hypothetical protein AMJ80_05035, partial [bacterium SM23_31]
TIIKNEETTFDDDTAVVGEKMVVESEAFVLKLYKKDGVIDSIDIECRCGRKAKIQLEYEKYSPYDDDEIDISESEDEAGAVQQSAADESHDKETEAGIESTEAEKDDETLQETLSDSDVEPDSVQDANNAEDNEEFQEGIPAPKIPEQPDPETLPNKSETHDTAEQQKI